MPPNSFRLPHACGGGAERSEAEGVFLLFSLTAPSANTPPKTPSVRGDAATSPGGPGEANR